MVSKPRQGRHPFRDPLDVEFCGKGLAARMVSIASSEENWRVVHSTLVFRPPSQAGRRRFEPIAHSLEVLKFQPGSVAGIRNRSWRLFLIRWGIDFRRREGLLRRPRQRLTTAKAYMARKRHAATASCLHGDGHESAAARVKGSDTYRERMAIPADAVFEAALEDVSKTDEPATISAAPASRSPATFLFGSRSRTTRRGSFRTTNAVRARILPGFGGLCTHGLLHRGRRCPARARLQQIAV